MAGCRILHVRGDAGAPLDAASAALLETLAEARAALADGEDVVLTFAPAGHEHNEWRRALVQGLAREAAPDLRVNGVIGAAGDGAVAEIAGWLAAQPGITGQILAARGASAINPPLLVR